MDKIVEIFSKAPQTRSQNDDDFADRLSSRYTVVLLISFSILVGISQYVRTPITCWAPVHFDGSHIKFTNSYCWVKNTYYLPWEEPVPRESDSESEMRQMIPYYQWIPFILLGQAFLFYIPSTIWHSMNSKSGVDVDNILAAAHTFSRTDRAENRDRTLKMIINQMDRFLRARGDNKCQAGGTCLLTCNGACGPRNGCFLLIVFLLSKAAYIANIVSQLFILGSVLSTRYSTFGPDILHSMATNVDWTEDSYVAFPRVTLCDFKVRGQDMANVHPYTVQCVLPVNLYNEKIYVFLWFWMIFVAVVSTISFFVWLVRCLLSWDRQRFVNSHLSDRLIGNKANSDPVELDDELTKRFTSRYLQIDGVLLLRLVAHNTNGITTSEIMRDLYDNWEEKLASSNQQNDHLIPSKEQEAKEE